MKAEETGFFKKTRFLALSYKVRKSLQDFLTLTRSRKISNLSIYAKDDYNSMISISIKKGLGLNIEGKPSDELEESGKPVHVAVLPEKIPFIKPRLLIEVNDDVSVGSPLFEDKRNPDIKFLSPGAGKIADINFGPRRVIREIVIKLSDVETCTEYPAVSEDEIEHLERDKLVRLIMDGGLWPLIRELPFRDYARPDHTPPAIFVSLGAEEPFQPEPDVYLKNKKELFEYGIRVLKKLAENVCISVSQDNSSVLKKLNGLVTHTYKGVYPADDPGVLLYHTKKSASENRSWYINGQDVLLLAYLLKTGSYPTERTVVIAGSSAKEKKHIATRLGAPIGHITQGRAEKDARYVVGGIFRGYISSEQTCLGFYETSVLLIPEGKEEEFLGFIRPGYNKPSYSSTFLSVFHEKPFRMNCNFHGEERACVACGSCSKVCPVDILPQLTFKCILADEVEESLEHGLLDCAECGLCSYVCPSKIDMMSVLKSAKAAYYKELS
ncbi:MAG: Na(+)-translocating NADH-quinone reductase subunit A [Desulfobacteraceae bacterium]|nr:Na(+)-translocating NADH-quinone reductase subunit A [Desulfobacteraceae bacterium]